MIFYLSFFIREAIVLTNGDAIIMDQIKYKTGDFQLFTATRSFALGTLGVTVSKSAELKFDGTIIDYAETRYTFPQLRSAVTAGWLVPSDEYDESNRDYGKPMAANIKVRPLLSGAAKPFETATEVDERVVMSSAEHASATKERNKASRDILADQEGVPVRTLKTAAKSRTKVEAQSVGTILREAEDVQIDAGQGRTEAEMLERMTSEDRETYLSKKSSLRSLHMNASIVGKIKTAESSEKEGIKLTPSVGGGIEVADMSGMTGKVKESVLVEDGITFRNVNGPERNTPEMHPRAKKAMVEDGTVNARMQVAKAICKDFPNSYDFRTSAKKKIAKLQTDFGKRPDVIKAVFAAESDDFKARLVDAFPSVFSK